MGANVRSDLNITLDERFASMHSEARVGPRVHIQVSDTGSGIPEEIRDRIFEPFFSTKDVDKGSGLGLTTVLGIIKDHAGFVSFTSLSGPGTTFDIHLPATPEQSTEGGPELVIRSIPRGQGELVLIVDDEPAILDAVQHTLTRHGYQVMRACDGVDGVAQFTKQGNAVRAVLTDIMMPRMDGTTLCRIIRRLSPATPIIVSTGAVVGQSAQVIAKTLAELGIRHVLAKPHTADALLQAIHEVLRSRGKV